MPGMNPRKMAQAMKRMGIQQTEIDATQVIIKTPEKQIIINNPQVSKVNMMGQETFQVAGQIEEQSLEKEAEITEEDIKTVMQQADVDEEKAKEALEHCKGDLAEAIIWLKG